MSSKTTQKASHKKGSKSSGSKSSTDRMAAFEFLNERGGKEVEKWVKDENAITEEYFNAQPGYRKNVKDFTKILDSQETLPDVTSLRDGMLYSVQKTAEHPIGLWRRTTLGSYSQEKPKWETVLDLDKLSKDTGSKLFLDGVETCADDPHRVLLSLHPDGARYTNIVREFDLKAKEFVKDRPFKLLEASTSQLSWVDKDTVVFDDALEEGSKNQDGYPRRVKLWRRGAPRKDATLIFDGSDSNDMSGWVNGEGDRKRLFISDRTSRDYYTYKVPDHGKLDFDAVKSGLQKIDLPSDAEIRIQDDRIALRLRSDWPQTDGTTLKQDTLVGARLSDYMDGKSSFKTIYEPPEDSALISLYNGLVWTGKDKAILKVVNEAQQKLHTLHTPTDGPWRLEPIKGVPGNATYSVKNLHGVDDGSYMLEVSEVTAPPKHVLVKSDGSTKVLKQGTATYNPDDFEVNSYVTRSENGKIPYFVVRKKGTDNGTPTKALMRVYGGFGAVNAIPGQHKMDLMAHDWLSAGNIAIYPYLTGDGHYGTARSLAGSKENTSRTTEDLMAVLADCEARGTTTSKQTIIMGASHGGYTVANAMLDHSDKIGGAIIMNGVLDLSKYADWGGSHWDRYYLKCGNPEEAEKIPSVSPMDKLKTARSDAKYPPTLICCNSSDDLVDPKHSRRFHALLKASGGDTIFFENDSGGHSTVTNPHQASMHAKWIAFANDKLPNASSASAGTGKRG